jgi:hypothetical protein
MRFKQMMFALITNKIIFKSKSFQTKKNEEEKEEKLQLCAHIL